MKKLITILAILVAIVGSVFAAQNEQLQINVTVSTVAPIFSIYGGKTAAEAEGTTYKGNATPTEITFTETEKNLAVNDITVYIRLYQSNKAKFKGTATLTIEATPLVNTDTTITGGVTSTAAPDADNIEATPNISGITYGANAAPSATKANDKTTVTFAPIYDGRAIQATDIGTFDLTWSHDDDLAAGSYKATIKLTYTPQ